MYFALHCPRASEDRDTHHTQRRGLKTATVSLEGAAFAPVIHRDTQRSKWLQIHCLDMPTRATTDSNAGTPSDATPLAKDRALCI